MPFECEFNRITKIKKKYVRFECNMIVQIIYFNVFFNHIIFDKSQSSLGNRDDGRRYYFPALFPTIINNYYSLSGVPYTYLCAQYTHSAFQQVISLCTWSYILYVYTFQIPLANYITVITDEFFYLFFFFFLKKRGKVVKVSHEPK